VRAAGTGRAVVLARLPRTAAEEYPSEAGSSRE
jgi:hypothetical protein